MPSPHRVFGEGEPQVNRMQEGPALRMQRGSKGHGRVLNPRETLSEIRAGSSATLLPPLPACLPGFRFPAFSVCVSLPFLSFEGKKDQKHEKWFSTPSCTYSSFKSPGFGQFCPYSPFTITSTLQTPPNARQFLSVQQFNSTLATTFKQA